MRQDFRMHFMFDCPLSYCIPQVALAPLAWVLGHEILGADLNPADCSLGPESELSQVAADPQTCDIKINLCSKPLRLGYCLLFCFIMAIAGKYSHWSPVSRLVIESKCLFPQSNT